MCQARFFALGVEVRLEKTDWMGAVYESREFFIRCLREICRMLRPDGLLSLTELKLGDPDFIPMPEMPRSVQASGFRRYAQYGIWFNYTVNFRKPV
jgi:hypothetical protein